MFVFVSVALQPPAPSVGPPSVLPWVVQKFTEPAVGGVVHAMLAEYFTESAKYASSAVTRLRRSDFIEAIYAFALVFANFGIAIAAKMPMITTTIRSSMSVKPLRFILVPPRIGHANRTLSSIRQKQGTCLARGRRPDMMKSRELAVRSRATAPQGGAVFCKSVGVLQAALRNTGFVPRPGAPVYSGTPPSSRRRVRRRRATSRRHAGRAVIGHGAAPGARAASRTPPGSRVPGRSPLRADSTRCSLHDTAAQAPRAASPPSAHPRQQMRRRHR